MPKCMATGGLRNPSVANRSFDCVLEVLFANVVATSLASPWIDRNLFGREDVLPWPFANSVWIFAMECARKKNGTATAGEILLMKLFHARKVRLKRAAEPFREHGHAFPHSFAFADGDLAIAEIDVLHAEAKAFEQAQAAAVEQVRH